MEKVEEIKRLIKSECEKPEFAGKRNWFFSTHLLGVEKYAEWLLERLSEVDKEIVMLSVWLHDVQRIRMISGDHQQIGAQEATKTLKDFGYKDEIVNAVSDVIKTHSCDDGNLPNSVEGKVLATADAMSHFVNDFYLHIATLGDRTVDEFKQWTLDKLDRDYNTKIHFDFAREEIRDKYEVLLKIMTMK